MLTYLAILLIILAETIFSEFAPAQSTNWSIFYFSSVFVSYIMIITNEILRAYNKTMRYLLFSCWVFMFLMLLQQLFLINSTYNVYYESVNDSFIDLVRHLFIISTFIILTFKYIRKWAKL